jgi:hypothetical protein
MLRMLMLPAVLTTALIVPASVDADPDITLKSVSVDLPDPGRMFEGADADAINNNCLACHSAGMVLNQPNLPRASWAAEVDKMIHTYHAPVEPNDVEAIVSYLARIKGAQ